MWVSIVKSGYPKLLSRIKKLGVQKYQVLKNQNGFYIGLSCPVDGPFYRSSSEYWPNKEAAEEVLRSGQWEKKEN